MNNPDLNKLARPDWQPYTPPFRYDSIGGQIRDFRGQLILDIRGWGFLTGLGQGGLKMDEDEAASVQDRIGNNLIQLMNSESRAAPASAEQQEWQHKIADFVNAILHGDEIHKAWLREAGEAFILGKPLPPLRDGKSGFCCIYCGLGAQELKPPHYLKRVNRLGDTPAKWICTEHQYHEPVPQPQKERTGT